MGVDIFARHKAITVTGARAAAKDVFSAWQPPCRSARLFPNFTVSNGCFIQNFFARPESYHSQKYSTAEVFDCFKMLQSASLVRKWRRRMPSMPRSRSPAQRKRQLHPIGSRWQRMLIMNQSSVCSCATWNEVCLHIPGVAHFFQSDGGSRNEMLGNR